MLEFDFGKGVRTLINQDRLNVDENVINKHTDGVCVLLLQFLSTRDYSKTLLMEEVLQRYLGDELAERKKIHEEEMKELSK